MWQVVLMVVRSLLFVPVVGFLIFPGCEQNVTQACVDRQEVCRSFCDFSVECMDIFDPECVARCVEAMPEYPVSWLKTCVDNAKLIADKDERCQIAYYEEELDGCLNAERRRSSWACSDSHTVTVCSEDGCCVVTDCIDLCGAAAASALCEPENDGEVGCVCS